MSKGNHDGLKAMTPNICARDKTPLLPRGQTTSSSHQKRAERKSDLTLYIHR